MIKANELRIGNWIYNPLQKIPFKVDFTALSNVYYDNKLDKPRYEPIPLTEEILLKCGFNYRAKTDIMWFNYANKIPFEIYEIDNGFYPDYVEDNGIEIKHLHQLQNLYFALTAEELKIEL